MTVFYYHVKYAFQSESTLYNCLNFKEILARNRSHIWSLSNSNRIRTHNLLVHKQTLSHVPKVVSLAEWLSARLRIKYLWVRIPLLSLKLEKISYVVT